MDLLLNNLQRLICHKTQTTNFAKDKSVETRVAILFSVVRRKKVHILSNKAGIRFGIGICRRSH